MDPEKSGELLFRLRKEKAMTQLQVAQALHISDKTVSKWECGLGCPDVSLLGSLSELFGVNIEQILLGELNSNEMSGGNMKRMKFYICPSCGNVLTSTADADISCCGRKVTPLSPHPIDAMHTVSLEHMDDEDYLTISHEMTKDHFISFAACVTLDRVMLIKLYPEQDPCLRFPRIRGGIYYICCSDHGLFYFNPVSVHPPGRRS